MPDNPRILWAGEPEWIETVVEMKNKRLQKLTYLFIAASGIIFLYLLVFTWVDGYRIWGEDINFQVTGQFGDFIGGVLGTIFSGAAFYFLFLTLNEQRDQNIKQADKSARENFERTFFELVSLHRSNVSELRYIKLGKVFESRNAFRVFTEEFISCHHEILRFAKMYPDMDDVLVHANHKEALLQMRKKNGFTAAIMDWVYIDIAYCFFFYGVEVDSETTLLHSFNQKYDNQYTKKMKLFLQLKPSADDIDGHAEWSKFVKQDVKVMREQFEWIYSTRLQQVDRSSLPVCENLSKHKYYNGHQDKLGHYFRHLFQSFKYISVQINLNDSEKYFYGKTLRAQLSTHEQFMLLFNSLSSIGLRWEYTAEIDSAHAQLKADQFKLITKYNLVKNLPGPSLFNTHYRRYYPRVQYEFREIQPLQ